MFLCAPSNFFFRFCKGKNRARTQFMRTVTVFATYPCFSCAINTNCIENEDKSSDLFCIKIRQMRTNTEIQFKCASIRKVFFLLTLYIDFSVRFVRCHYFCLSMGLTQLTAQASKSAKEYKINR